jgi:hypothetical protein
MSAESISQRQWGIFSKQQKMDHIIHRTAIAYGFKFDELVGHARPKNLAFARQVAMWLCYKKTSSSSEEIAKHFGGRVHTTVLHACRVIDKHINSNASDIDAIIDLDLNLLKPVKEEGAWTHLVSSEDHPIMRIINSMELSECDKALLILKECDCEFPDSENRVTAIEAVKRLLAIIEKLVR